MRTKRRQTVFLICLAVLVIALILFFLLRDQEEPYTSDFTENGREDVVVYGGKEYRYNEHLSNYLFVGVDTREPITEYDTRDDAGRADTIFFLSYDRVKKTIKCISIPRDTIANVHMIAPDGTDLGISREHINMQYAFGDGKEESCQLMKEAVSDMFYGVPIQGYYSLNMDGIVVAVDVLDGVEIIVPDNSLEHVNAEFSQGAKVTITRENAEQFIRYRDTEKSQSAITRMNRQKELMKAVLERARQRSSEDAEFIIEMYEGLKPYTVTNMGNDILAKLLEADFDSETGVIDVPGEGVQGNEFDEYHLDENQLYELVLQLFYEEV